MDEIVSKIVPNTQPTRLDSTERYNSLLFRHFQAITPAFAVRTTISQPISGFGGVFLSKCASSLAYVTEVTFLRCHRCPQVGCARRCSIGRVDPQGSCEAAHSRGSGPSITASQQVPRHVRPRRDPDPSPIGRGRRQNQPQHPEAANRGRARAARSRPGEDRPWPPVETGLVGHV